MRTTRVPPTMILALPHPIMAKVAAPCFRSSQSPHDDGTTQPDTSLPQICRSYQRPFWKLCKLGSTETHRGRPVLPRVTSVLSLPVAYAFSTWLEGWRLWPD